MVFNLAKNIIFRAAFSAELKNEDQDELISILREFSKLFGAVHIGDYIPWLKWPDLNGTNVQSTKARGALDRFISRIIDEHVANLKEANASNADMVDYMLAVMAEEGKTQMGDQQGSLRLTQENVKAIIMDIMFGGTETVASAIEWAMAELMKNPEYMKQVQHELTEVVGIDRMVHESDLERLPYLKCVIKETLRLHPPIPVLLQETSKNCEIGSYSIPEQSQVMINMWAIGREKLAGKDADSFKPDQFAPDCDDSNIDFKGNFLPFGSGRRSCPGMQLGLYALELAVTNLMHCFDWTLPDGMKPNELDMNDVFGLTAPRVMRLMAVPSPRLNCQVA